MTASLLAHLVVRSTLVLLAGLGLTQCLAGASSATRRFVWAVTCLAALAVPLVFLAGPVWPLDLLSAATTIPTGRSKPAVRDAGTHATVRPVAPNGEEDGRDLGVRHEMEGMDIASSDTVAVSTDAGAPGVFSVRAGDVVVWTWLGGAAWVLLQLCVGLGRSRSIRTSAREVDDPEWCEALAEAQRALRCQRAMALRVSAEIDVPMAVGVWRPAVLLPSEAMGWSAARRRVALLHEVAHVAGADCAFRVLAQLLRAAHWFNPLAHAAATKLRIEQERTCDDRVLGCGADAGHYATELVAIARHAVRPPWTTVAAAMVRPSELESRVRAILDQRRARRAPTLIVRTACVVGTVFVAVAAGVTRLTAEAETPRSVQAAPVVMALLGEAEASPASRPADQVRGLNDIESRVRASEAAVPSLEVRDDLFEVRVPSLSLAVSGMAADDIVESRVRLSAQASTPVVTPRAQVGGQPITPPAVSDDTRRRVAEALASALGDANAEVRQEALSGLADMRDPRAIPGLVKALDDASPQTRVRALGALAQFDNVAAADGILGSLRDTSPDVRQQAARQLAGVLVRGQLRDPKYVDGLVACLRDDDPDVRAQAARALGALGDPRAIDPLSTALQDREPAVREQAARALGQIARGQRRATRPTPGVRVPAVPEVLPTPAVPPQAFRRDVERADEFAALAREAAARARFEIDQHRRELERFDLPGVPGVRVAPVPQPRPEMPAPPIPVLPTIPAIPSGPPPPTPAP